MTLSTIGWVALGGAMGAVLRFGISALLLSGGRFPWATLGINIAGSFLIGLCWGAWLQENPPLVRLNLTGGDL